MKKGPLSNREKEYIESFYETTPVKDLASRMDRSFSIVEKFVDTLPTGEPVKEKPAAEKTQVKQPSRASELFARNKERGVVIMTEASSMESDKKPRKNKQPAKYRQIIHKIKGD
jgi:hypothetical protein